MADRQRPHTFARGTDLCAGRHAGMGRSNYCIYADSHPIADSRPNADTYSNFNASPQFDSDPHRNIQPDADPARRDASSGRRPLPTDFLRTPPKVVRITTNMVDRTPEILIQLNQGIVPELALEKDRYSVDTSGAQGALGTTSGGSGIKISRVEYRAKSDTIILRLPRKPKVEGNVVLTVDAHGIVNLLGQALEGDNLNPGMNLVLEVDLP
jgi:hypothetical protein